MNLFPYQRVAVQALEAEIAKGGSFKFSMPVGCGRSIIIAHALRNAGKAVFLFRTMEIGDQMIALCNRLGVTNIDFYRASPAVRAPLPDLSQYAVVILAEEHRPWPEIDHPCVIQQGWSRFMPFAMAIGRPDGSATSVTVQDEPVSTTTRKLEDPQ